MRIRFILASVGTVMLLSAVVITASFAQSPPGTAFTYQGRLEDADVPVEGTCDFSFSLYGSAKGTDQIGTTLTILDWPVAAGYFTVPLDFGSGAFRGDARYLAIAVRCPAGEGSYTTLAPRQALTPSPHALALPGFWTQQNTTSPNLIGGHSGNSVTTGVVGATIGGGGYRMLTTSYANVVTDSYGTVGGGADNMAGDNSGTTDDAAYATVSGGYGNMALGSHATIAGGRNNAASGYAAAVPGGWSNAAQGQYSLAAGRRAKANHDGAFVWADATNADFASTGANQFLVRASGGMGVGTTSPGSHTLSVYSSRSGVAGSTAHVVNDNASGIAMTLESHSSDLTLLLSQHGEGDILRADSWVGGWHPVFKVQNNGNVECATLTITGGSDLSEQFDITDQDGNVQPGLVVCIDPDRPGDLVVCQQAYDRTVAGVVSGAGDIEPGMLMGQASSPADGVYPVAMTGRVYVWADASAGPIQPGDLLTTSRAPGHAMPVTDFDRANGAILGKAMSALEEGTGLVLVLVALQ
jgi:hypothetical protein